MGARVFRLLGIVVVSVFLGYLIGSNGLGGWTPPPSSALSPFLVSSLSIQPAKARPNEIVTITVSVANKHDTWGIYSLALKINGVTEDEKQATIDAGGSQDVSFSVMREDSGSYTVFVNGLSGSFIVVARQRCTNSADHLVKIVG